MTAANPATELDAKRSIHLVGIGGAGMSAIATVLVAMGHQVSGSDLKDSVALERLRARGVRVAIGHDARHIDDADLVATSSAIPARNVEVVEAIARHLPVWTRAQMLAAICRHRRTVAISGTHGKTTTSSMLSLILVEAGLAPSFLIGGEVNEIGTNAVWGAGDLLVVEADESDGTFLELNTEIAVVTNIEADHLDHYGSLDALEAAFSAFMVGARHGAVVNADDPVALGAAPESATTFGFAEAAQLRIVDFDGGRSNISFRIVRSGTTLGTFTLPVPGELNARNAAAAIAVCVRLGVPLDAAQRALARFAGVARRFEFRGERAGITFVDDYAHLPGEITATLAAARRGGWSRVVAVFQPHRYSRVARLAKNFADSFVEADVVVITGIYGAGEDPVPGVSAKLILDAVLAAHPTTAAAYLSQRSDLVMYLKGILRPGDCCLTLGAGDLTTLPDELLVGPW